MTAEERMYRQAALELQAEIRWGLQWIRGGAEPSVAHASMQRCADKWLPVLDDDVGALPDER